MARFHAALLVVAALLAGASAGAAKSDAAINANPVRKVVTLLQKMAEKVAKEAKQEEELYDKFMCYCKTSGGDLSTSIADAQAKIESMTSSIEEGKSKKSQTEADLKEHQTSRADAKEAMAAATALREKEAASFGKEKSESETNLAALAKAIKAIDKGVMGGFLQTSAANVVRQYAMEKADLPDTTRQELLAFLSGTQGEGYVPQSGEITGILKTMHDEMSKGLEDTTAEENSAIQTYEALMAAKKKEVAVLQAQIEVEMTRVGNLGVSISGEENDLVDTKEALTQDEQFTLELKKSCDTKTAEWEEIKKTRAEELVALADTIKVLNDDDALDLFKKTLPSASSSFVQMRASNAALRAKALALLKAVRSRPDAARLDFISLALRSKKIGFEKVIKMIGEMVATLKQEQLDDDHKVEYCNSQLDKADDKKKVFERKVADEETAIDNAKEAISTLTEEIAALEAGIKALDKEVAEATEQRKAEHKEFTKLMASDSAAKELLKFAKNRLDKFYNPKLYKAPPKRELTEAERISVANGGTLSPTSTPGGIAGTGVTVFAQIRAHVQRSVDAPPPPPETFGPYTTKSEENTGVIAMIDLLIKDLGKEMTEAETTEKDSQADYEALMKDSADKRTADSKSLTEKEAAKADTEALLEKTEEEKGSADKELGATLQYVASLHAECDWLLQYFDARKAARSSEMEALTSAKAVLSGADYSLLQTSL
mmetsp:Transcript_64502/g.165969  ORF Transcript_64502/g.165969 Transcript_64502/m.165969 type:complete len:717 (+) Transcript_64502:64-2214(+)